jgi:ABC-type Co2+ transport system permease subunit
MIKFKNRYLAAAFATIYTLAVATLPIALFTLIYIMGGYKLIVGLIILVLIGGIYYMMYEDKTFYKDNSN